MRKIIALLFLMLTMPLAAAAQQTFASRQANNNFTGQNTLAGVKIEWSNAAPYQAYQIVSYMGVMYQSIAGANLNHTPTDTMYWTPVSGEFNGGAVSGNTFFTGGWPSFDVLCTNNLAADTAAFWGAITTYQSTGRSGIINVKSATANEPCLVDGTAGTIGSGFYNGIINVAAEIKLSSGPLHFVGGSTWSLNGIYSANAGTSFHLGPSALIALANTGLNLSVLDIDNTSAFQLNDLLVVGGTGDKPAVYMHNDVHKWAMNNVAIVQQKGAYPLTIEGTGGDFDGIINDLSLTSLAGNGDTGGGLLYIKNYGNLVLGGSNWFLCGQGSTGDHAIKLEGAYNIEFNNITGENCGGFYTVTAWSSGSTYNLTTLTRAVYMGVTYQSLQTGNINHQPDISPTWWEVAHGAMFEVAGNNNSKVTINNAGMSDRIAGVHMYLFHNGDPASNGVNSVNLKNTFSNPNLGSEFDGVFSPYGYPNGGLWTVKGSDADPLMYTNIGSTAAPSSFPYSLERGMVRVDDVRRLGVPTIPRFENLAFALTTYDMANLVLSGSASSMTGVADYLAGTAAATITSSSGTSTARVVRDNGTVLGAISVGDRYLFGVAFQSGVNGVTPAGVIDIDCNSPVVCAKISALGTIANDLWTHNGGTWQWIWTVVKVTETGGGFLDFNLQADNLKPVTFAFPIVHKITDATIPDVEVLKHAMALTPFTNQCSIGELCTVDGPVASGGTPTLITVADTTDTTAFCGLFEGATGDLGPKTDAGCTYNAETGMLTATGFTGPLTGNASTVTNGVYNNAQYTGEFMVKAGYKSGPGLDTTTDDEDDVFINRTGVTITITEVYCRSDAGTPTVNLLRNDGSAANIFTSDLTCDLTPTGTNGTDGILTSFVSGENLVADGQAVNLNVTAASTANVATMAVKYTKAIQ